MPTPPPPANPAERGSRPPRRRPRISVAGILFLTVCVAVSVAAALPGPVNAAAGAFIAQIDWWSAALALSTVGLSTTLLQQAASVRGAAEYRVARWVRYAIVVGLAGCFAIHLLQRRGVLGPPDRESFLASYIEPLFDAPWYVLLLLGASLLTPVAASANAAPWRRRAMAIALLGATCVYVSHAISEMTLVTHLVHLATAGIDAALPGDFQRTDAFPNHVAEGFFTYWTATAAAGVLVAATLATIVTAKAERRATRAVARLAFAAGVATLACYGWWYFHVEMPRLSPDVASVAWIGTSTDWVGGAWILVALAAWMASLLSKTDDPGRPAPLPNTSLGRLPLAVGAISLLLVALTWFGTMVATHLSMVSTLNQIFPTPLLERISQMGRALLLAPQTLLSAATTIVAVRLVAALLRRRETRVHPLPAGRWAEAFLQVLALGLVAIPTLAAYAFCSHFGPWWIG